MATYTQVQGTRSASILVMGTLGSTSYGGSSAVDLGANIPLDVTIEVEATPGTTPTGNKQLVIMAKISHDNINWGSGPETGVTTTNEGDEFWLGVLPTNDTSLHRKHFSLSMLPVARYFKIIVRNDLGVALASGNVYWYPITGSGA